MISETKAALVFLSAYINQPVYYSWIAVIIGFSGNNNLGFEKAKELGCAYVHLTNEDTEVDPDYLTHAVARAESDPKIAAVQSLILLGQDRDRINSAGNAYHFLGHGYSTGYRLARDGYPVTGEEIGSVDDLNSFAIELPPHHGASLLVEQSVDEEE